MATRTRLAVRLSLIGGILSPLLYVAMTVFIGMQWDGYSSASQTISELSAIDAPTRSLWLPPAVLYTILVTAFGWGRLDICLSKPRHTSTCGTPPSRASESSSRLVR